jgi:hypothetical protein
LVVSNGNPKNPEFRNQHTKCTSNRFPPTGKSAIKNYSPGIWKSLWTWTLDISSGWESLVTNKIK